MEKSHIARLVSLAVLWLNILVLVVLVALGLKELQTLSFSNAKGVFPLLLFGVLTGLLCAGAKKGLMRLCSLFLFLFLFSLSGMVFMNTKPDAGLQRLFFIGIDLALFIYWVYTVFSDGVRFGWKAILLGVGYAATFLVFLFTRKEGLYGLEGIFYSANLVAMFFPNSTTAASSTDDAQPREKRTPSQLLFQGLCFLGKLILALVIIEFVSAFFLGVSLFVSGVIKSPTPKQVTWMEFDQIWKVSFPSTVQWEKFQRDGARDFVTFHGRFLVPEEEMEKLFPPERFPREPWTPPTETEPLKVIQSLFPNTPETAATMRDSLEETFPWIASGTPCPNEVYLVHRRHSLYPDMDPLDTDSSDTDSPETLDMVIENTTQDKHLYTVYIYYKIKSGSLHHGTMPPED